MNFISKILQRENVSLDYELESFSNLLKWMKKYRNEGSTANGLAGELDITEEKRKFSTKRTRRKKIFLSRAR